jgi:dihydropteroate synthase
VEVRVREVLPAALRGAGRTLVMGVVNVTPDSFSDGGQWFAPEAAAGHGRLLLAQGADIVDVGGESTRPGAARVDPAEELRRVLPVVEALAAAGAVVSIDTMRAEVAARAVAAGAALVNDVSGGLADPDMAAAVAEARVPLVVTHWRGHSDVMDALATYDDVVEEVVRHLRERVRALAAAGVDPRALILDPGLGFAKPGAANWPILARLEELVALGHPVLVGASRKRFLGHVLAAARARAAAAGSGVAEPAAPPEPVPPAGRDAATAAVSALAALAGAWAVRVHDVPSSFDAVVVAAAWRAARRPGGASR